MLRLLVIVVGAYDALYLGVWLVKAATPRFGDFFALWTFGRFALTQPLAAIYDPLTLQQFQRTIDPAFTEAYPFLYPPTFLLLAVPLGLLPLAAAWCAWCAGGLVLYVTLAAGRAWRSLSGAALLVAPTTLLAIVAGQSGLLTGALLLGGTRLVPARPWLGGALLGLLIIKPQLAVLVPVALVAAGAWRAIIAAAVAALIVLLAGLLAFGWDLWAVWVHNLPDTADLILRNRAAVARIAPTVGAGLFQLGIPDTIARIIQAAAAAAAAVAVWRACRHGLTPHAIAVLAMATFLATPYGYIYDMPAVGGALVLLAGHLDRRRIILAAAIVLVPVAMLRTALPLVEPILLAAMIVVLSTRRAGTTGPARRPVAGRCVEPDPPKAGRAHSQQ